MFNLMQTQTRLRCDTDQQRGVGVVFFVVLTDFLDWRCFWFVDLGSSPACAYPDVVIDSICALPDTAVVSYPLFGHFLLIYLQLALVI